eukprot:CAMPEP_0194279386 /NCGR_PEP_ID=MMETSP0169-20130528/13899_1 /TAXON_ID=218684 /ORGANISM="Corethron pennatum, Strain L29A3" /LENGTH=280 /DNA_ID=CAMNT_0039023799 /DNA_START=102 /DNA_END=944 /DNA_ORIENTATION=+
MSFPGRALQHTYHLVDASNQTLGRLASAIVPLLRGKHKPTFRPNADCGDTVVIVNAEKIRLTGRKMDGRGGKRGTGKGQKVYRWHTGYPGGLKERTALEMLERKPTELLRKAVLGMMRRNNLRHGYIEKRLRIYAGEDHPYASVLGSDTMPLPPVPRSLRTKRGEKGKDGAEADDEKGGDVLERPLYHFGLKYGYTPKTYDEVVAAGISAPARPGESDDTDELQGVQDDNDIKEGGNYFFLDTREDAVRKDAWSLEADEVFAKDLERMVLAEKDEKKKQK